MSVSKVLASEVEMDALVLGLSPAVATAALYASMVQSMGVLFENSVAAQKRQTLAGDIVVLESLLENLAVTAVDVVDEAERLDPEAELAGILKALKTSH